MEEMNLKEMACNLAVKAYNDIDCGEGNFDNNVKLLKESVKIATDLEQLDNPQKEELELEKLKAENAKLAAEAAKLLRESENCNTKADKYWDRGLKIAGIVVPVVTTAVTGLGTYLIFKEKLNFTNNTIKLNTLLEEKGYITGLNNSKIISNLFNELVKK